MFFCFYEVEHDPLELVARVQCWLMTCCVTESLESLILSSKSTVVFAFV